MDLEIGGKVVKKVDKPYTVFTNEEGDVFQQTKIITSTNNSTKQNVSFRALSEKAFSPKTQSKTELTYKELISKEGTQKQVDRLEEQKRERGQSDENAEILELPLPFRSIGERSSLTNLHNLMEQCPQPQPPLINKHLKTLQLNADQALIMAEQVQRMKTGMERLQEIIRKFNCTERFKQDIDFIIANVGPAIAKAELLRHKEQTVSNTQSKKQLHKDSQ